MESDSRALVDVESRRATLAKLADFLHSERTAALDQWLLAVRRDPTIPIADRLTHQQLIDHLPEIYLACCEFLRSREAALLVGDAETDAATHGELRWSDGYQIGELIRELEIFRGIAGAVVMRFAEIEPKFRGPIVAAAVALVQRYFGEITTHSVTQYSHEQQRVVRTYTDQLESANRELSRANVRLEQAVSDRQRLIAIVAQEVRAILVNMEAGRGTDAPEPPPAQSRLKDVEHLLGRLLDHTALIADRKALTPVDFSPADLHDELMQIFRPAVLARRLALIGDASHAPRRVRADRAHVKEVVENLLSNAIKFTAEGHVGLTFAAGSGEHWMIQVTDTGPGLTDAATGALMAGTAMGAGDVGGRTMGLAITKDLIDLLNGSVRVVSKMNAGTIFEVTLPVDAEMKSN